MNTRRVWLFSLFRQKKGFSLLINTAWTKLQTAPLRTGSSLQRPSLESFIYSKSEQSSRVRVTATRHFSGLISDSLLAHLLVLTHSGLSIKTQQKTLVAKHHGSWTTIAKVNLIICSSLWSVSCTSQRQATKWNATTKSQLSLSLRIADNITASLYY